MTGGRLDAIRRRDEILQLMFWLQGEGLAEEVGVEAVHRFLPHAGETVSADLAGLAEAGLLEAVGGGLYRLSETGRREGGRRFVDEFADMLGHGGHGACAPGCDCESLAEPAEDCPTHGRHAHRHAG